MLTVETYIAPSRIHGIGLFAKRPIEKCTLVAYFEPDFDRMSVEFASLPKLTQDFLLQSSFRVNHGFLLFNDNGRFINHKRDCNLGYCAQMSLSTPRFHGFVAFKNIPSGAELTTDYSTFDKEHYKRINDYVELRDAQIWPPKVKLPEGTLSHGN
jgi:SET domain-containing protein